VGHTSWIGSSHLLYHKWLARVCCTCHVPLDSHAMHEINWLG
jgi:hypothetical protein